MGTIAFIDNFINDPVNHCVNDFIETYGVAATYHQPARFGFGSLDELQSDPLGVVILGSASHVNENLDWHKQLDIYFKRWQANRIPVLGICFGHQFIVHSFGGKVDYHSVPVLNLKLMRDVTFTRDFWSYRKGEVVKYPYAHEQIVTVLPDEFESVAKTDKFPFEIIEHKKLPIYGIQAHPESSLRFIDDIRGEADPSGIELKAAGRLFLGEFLSVCKSQTDSL